MTYSRRGIHGEVVHDLAMRIVGGQIPPGSPIDLEELGAEAQVSRTVVREALRVLTAKGLVEARPRWGTRVRDRAEWNMLDPDLLEWQLEADVEPAFLSDLSVVRQAIEPAAARLAAKTTRKTDRKRMREAFEAFEAALSDDVAGLVEADVNFHRAILEASGNLFFRQMGPLLSAALRGRDALVFRNPQSRRPEGLMLAEHRAVLDAILARDADDAERLMRLLMDRAALDTDSAIRAARRPTRPGAGGSRRSSR